MPPTPPNHLSTLPSVVVRPKPTNLTSILTSQARRIQQNDPWAPTILGLQIDVLGLCLFTLVLFIFIFYFLLVLFILTIFLVFGESTCRWDLVTVGAHFMASCRIIPQRAAKSFTMLWKLNNLKSAYVGCCDCWSTDPQKLRTRLHLETGFERGDHIKRPLGWALTQCMVYLCTWNVEIWGTPPSEGRPHGNTVRRRVTPRTLSCQYFVLRLFILITVRK